MSGSFGMTRAFVGTKVTDNSSEEIPDNLDVPKEWSTVRYDDGDLHSSCDESILTFNRPGIYLVQVNVAWEPVLASGIRQEIIREGTSDSIAGNRASRVVNAQTRRTMMTIWNFDIAEYISLRVFQDSGLDVDIQKTGNYSPELSATLIGTI
jgi:hypothetical protein